MYNFSRMFFQERKKIIAVAGIAVVIILLSQCKKDVGKECPPESMGGCSDPTPYLVDVPRGLPPFPYDYFAELTVEGVDLGRHLFYDPALSADSSISCASCHKQENAFSGGVAFNIGVDGFPGKRNAMNDFNLAYVPKDIYGVLIPLFWDGRAATVEDQALFPIQDALEMHSVLPDVIDKLRENPAYPPMFCAAFGDTAISVDRMAQALAQFERAIVSANTKYDSTKASLTFMTDDQVEGYLLFNDAHGGDCFHCHPEGGGFFTDYTFKDNGLDSVTHYSDFTDPGRGAITGDTADYGKFRVPSLRNVELTAPYMHDGRFATLNEVLDFYSEKVHKTPFTDPLMQFADSGGVHLTDTEKMQIIEFLKTLTDHSITTNPAYSNPW